MKTAFEEITERVLFGQRMMLVIHPDNVSDQLRFEAETAGFEIKEDRYCGRSRVYIFDLDKIYTEYISP